MGEVLVSRDSASRDFDELFVDAALEWSDLFSVVPKKIPDFRSADHG